MNQSNQTQNTASKHSAINNHQPPDNDHSGAAKPQTSEPPSLYHSLIVDAPGYPASSRAEPADLTNPQPPIFNGFPYYA